MLRPEAIVSLREQWEQLLKALDRLSPEARLKRAIEELQSLFDAGGSVGPKLVTPGEIAAASEILCESCSLLERNPLLVA